jgi:hypothetical protein
MLRKIFCTGNGLHWHYTTQNMWLLNNWNATIKVEKLYFTFYFKTNKKTQTPTVSLALFVPVTGLLNLLQSKRFQRLLDRGPQSLIQTLRVKHISQFSFSDFRKIIQYIYCFFSHPIRGSGQECIVSRHIKWFYNKIWGNYFKYSK